VPATLRPRSLLHACAGLVVLVVVTASGVAPAAASAASAAPVRTISIFNGFANRSDPFVGPLTREAERHSGDVLHLAPATGQAMTRVQPAGNGRLGAGGPLSLSFNRAGLQKEVMGFAPYWTLSQESGWDYNVLSTVNYFGLTLAYDGSWDTSGGGYTGFSSQALVDMINRAHAAGDRVLLAVEASGQAALNDIVTYPPSTAAALANIVAAIGSKPLDGVNIDFEGYTSSQYPNIQTGLTDFMSQLDSQVHAKWPQDLVTIDTYSGSASWDFGLMKIDALAPYVDAMFIMAYDMSFSNMPGQAGPNDPINGWTYDDSLSVSQYLTKAPASKIVLGIPWYGYKFTTSSNAPYASESNAVADTYAQAQSDAACAHPAWYWDATAQSVWGVWYSGKSGDPCGANLGAWQELYYDDTRSLGMRYDLVNSSGIRGTGIWALGYDGGAPEVWGELNTYFSCPVTLTPPATVTTSEFSVGLSAGSCSVAGFDVQQSDSTLGEGWFSLRPSAISGGSATVTVEGFPGSTYQLMARSHSTAGVVSSWASISISVDTAATWSHPFKSLYTVDDYGGVHAADSPPLQTGAYWPGWKIVRAAHAIPGNPQSGLLLDGYGGLHPFGATTTIASTASWPGWDIARDFAFLADGSGGYVLDGYGGLHPFALGGHALPPAVTGAAYWRGWDVARKVVIFSDGTGGLVMDAYGGLHPFGIGGPAPAAPTGGPYWAGFPIARDLLLVPGMHAGYVLDGYGGIHPFSGAAAVSTPAYWAGWDIARSLWLLPSPTLTAPAGYLMDGYGGIHPFGGAPPLASYSSWPGVDVAHDLTGN
jgi:hypothetical protein